MYFLSYLYITSYCIILLYSYCKYADQNGKPSGSLWFIMSCFDAGLIEFNVKHSKYKLVQRCIQRLQGNTLINKTYVKCFSINIIQYKIESTTIDGIYTLYPKILLGMLPYYNIISDEKVALYILKDKKLKRPEKCPKFL